MAVALELGVQGAVARIARMAITAIGVALPDLDPGALDGVTVEVEDPPCEIENLAWAAQAAIFTNPIASK